MPEEMTGAPARWGDPRKRLIEIGLRLGALRTVKTVLHIPDWGAIELPPHEQEIYERFNMRAR